MTAPAALDEDGYRTSGHVAKRTVRHNVLSKSGTLALYRPLGCNRIEWWRDIEFNPFTLVLKVHNLSFPDTEGRALVGFRELLVHLNLSSVFRFSPSFAAIELEEPFTSLVVRKDGTLNLVDLARPFEAGSTPAVEAEVEESLKLYIEQFRVTSGRIDFEDRARASVFHTRLAPIIFELRDFATTGEAGNSYALRAASVNDERFSWDGTFETMPFTSTVNSCFSALSMVCSFATWTSAISISPRSSPISARTRR